MATPDFIERSPTVIEAAIVAAWEEITGKTLFPAAAERLLLNLAVYREVLTRIGVQFAGEQSLVNYATDDRLDELGELVATPRLAAQSAIATVLFTKNASAVGTGITIPSGTLLSTPNGIVFATDEDLTIAPGFASGSVRVTCTTVGVDGNGFGLGQISQLLDLSSFPLIASAANTTVSSGGADIEADDPYRARIKLAPNKYSVAGSTGSYKFYTLSVSQTIIDVAVINSSRVVVDVYPLTAAGAPSSDLIDDVAAALNPDTVRPLTDIVNVYAPIAVDYTITAVVTRLTSADADELMGRLEQAAETFASDRRSKLGLDVTIASITKALMIDGVYDVVISSPASNLVVAANEWANCTAIDITFAPSAAEG